MDTTPATLTPEQGALADMVLGGFATSASNVIQEPPAAEPAVADAPPAAAGEPPANADVTPATEEKVEASPYDDLITERPAPIAWNDEVKAAFKARGIDDIDQMLTERSTIQEQLALRSEQLSKYEQLAQAEEALPANVKELIQRAREGKDVIAWAKEQASVDIFKPAAKIPKLDLVRQYFPDAFSEEELEAHKAGDDAAFMEQFDKKLTSWHKLAVKQHETAQAEPLAARKQMEAQQKADQELVQRSVAANVAYLKNNAPSMMALADAKTISKLSDFSIFTETFCEADGKTLKPSALHDLFVARDHKVILQRAVKVAEARGAEQERLRMAQRLPEAAAQARTARANPTVDKTEEQKARESVLSDFTLT